MNSQKHNQTTFMREAIRQSIENVESGRALLERVHAPSWPTHPQPDAGGDSSEHFGGADSGEKPLIPNNSLFA